MSTEKRKRKYTLKRRAAQQHKTRERIVDAAMKLHEELGPADTTISAIADAAGVQRLTVYRHFPTDRDVFMACSSKWFGLHPPPDVSAIVGSESADRTLTALRAFYRYYCATQRMWSVVYRDAEKLPALEDVMAGVDVLLESSAQDLLKDWSPRPRKQLANTVRHALEFSTWQSLARQGLSDRAMADLVYLWVCAAAE